MIVTDEYIEEQLQNTLVHQFMLTSCHDATIIRIFLSSKPGTSIQMSRQYNTGIRQLTTSIPFLLKVSHSYPIIRFD